MATTKKITEVQALNIATLMSEGKPIEEACAEIGFSVEEYRAKIKHIAKQRAAQYAKRPAGKGKSKDRMNNEVLARAIADAIRKSGEEYVSSKWIMEHVNYISSTQKVTAIMAVAHDLGLAPAGIKIKGLSHYRLYREGEIPGEELPTEEK